MLDRATGLLLASQVVRVLSDLSLDLLEGFSTDALGVFGEVYLDINHGCDFKSERVLWTERFLVRDCHMHIRQLTERVILHVIGNVVKDASEICCVAYSDVAFRGCWLANLPVTHGINKLLVPNHHIDVSI